MLCLFAHCFAQESLFSTLLYYVKQPFHIAFATSNVFPLCFALKSACSHYFCTKTPFPIALLTKNTPLQLLRLKKSAAFTCLKTCGLFLPLWGGIHAFLPRTKQNRSRLFQPAPVYCFSNDLKRLLSQRRKCPQKAVCVTSSL